MHGVPPRGTAERMAQEIRQIRTVNSFPDFFKSVGLTSKTIPGKALMCAFLKETIDKSVTMRYSCQPLSQAKALSIRQIREPGVEVKDGVQLNVPAPRNNGISFFPSMKGGKGRN